MSGHQSSLPFQMLQDGLFHNQLPHIHIESTDGVIEEVDVFVSIQGSCNGNPCLLTSTQVDSSVTEHSVDALGHGLKVIFQAGQLDALLELCFVVLTAKQYHIF